MMPYQLNFAKRQTYDSLEVGITIETILRYGTKQAVCAAKVDTGAHSCIFEREVGERLGLDIESGYQKPFGTLTGSFVAFGHEVVLETLGLVFDTMVYFPQEYGIRRNLLGRQGWLQAVRLGLVDYDCEIYLSRLWD
jgi:hypothetical protein